MTNLKSSKRALLVSLLALLLCLSLLIGSTFAWFTKSVTSGKNKIESGELQIQMFWAELPDEENKELAWHNVETAGHNAIFNYDRWEPGYTDVKFVKVVNNGNLALDYTMSIVPAGQLGILAEVIDVYYAPEVIEKDNIPQGEDLDALRKNSKADATLKHLGTLKEVIEGKEGTLLADTLKAKEEEPEVADYATIVLKMRNNAGNEYQGQSVGDGFDIHLYAKQSMSESDSFGSTYDEQSTYLNQNDNGEWLITGAADLSFFASQVNSGNDYMGETVLLASDIDLSDRSWTPIGTADHKFKGTFDGQGNTISNMTVSGNAGVGLFGYVEGTIQNVKLDYATVSGNHFVAGIVGHLKGSVTGCTVTNATITNKAELVGENKYDNGDDTGGIVGYAYGNLPTTRDAESTARTISGNTVTDSILTGYRDTGSIVGSINDQVTVTDNTAKNVTLYQDNTHNYKNYGTPTAETASFGNVVGRDLREEAVKKENKVNDDNTAENTVEIKTDQVASVSTAEDLTDALGKENEKEFISLTQDLKLDADETITVDKESKKILDLNGKTIITVSNEDDKNNDGKVTSADNKVAFDVRGTLTVKNGTMTIKHEAKNFEWNACTEVFYVGFNGTLNVENATIENLGGSDMAFAIDVVNADKAATLNISNSHIKSTYIPVRIFNNGAGMNNVTIKDSTIEGVSRAFWVHIYSSKDNGGKGVKGETLNLKIYGNNNTWIAKDPNRIIEFGFDDEINFDADGNQITVETP